MAITVQYGDYTLPLVLGSPGYQFGRTPDGRITFSCLFRVTGDPIASAVQTAYQKCHLKHKDLRVQIDGADVEYLQHSQSEALLGRATIRKTGGVFDTAVARHFIFEWVAEAPASDITGGTDGLLEYFVSVTTDTNGSRITLHEGKFTAEGLVTAKAKFEDPTTGAEAVAAAWHTANLSFGQAYRGFELMRPATVRYDDQTQTASYSLLYRERMIPEPDGAGALTTDEAGNANIKIGTVAVTKIANGWHGYHESPGDRSSRPVTYQIVFDATIDASQAYGDVGAFYEANKAAFASYLTNSNLNTGPNAGSLVSPILLQENVRAGLQAHQLVVTWVVLAAGNGDYTIFKESITSRTDYRQLIRDVADGTGQTVVHSPGPANFAVQEVDAERIGQRPELPHLEPLYNGGQSGWLILDESPRLEEEFTLTTAGTQVVAYRASISRAYRWIEGGAVFTEGPPP